MVTDDPEQRDSSRPRRRTLTRRMARLLLIIVLAYVGVCILAMWFQTRLVYFPSRCRDYPATPADVGLSFEDLTLNAADGISLGAWFIPHLQAQATVIFCHGNAGNISDRLHSVRVLHDLGYNVLIFDYRGFGRSTGRPGEQGTYLDAEAAWRHVVETRGEPPERVILIGRSLGGAVAIELARRHPPAALIVESTFTSIADVGKTHFPFLPVSLLLRHRYESINKVPQVTCPKLFMHGREDGLIPLANARRLYAAAAPPKRFIETPGEHNTAGFTYTDEYAKRMASFIDEVLHPPG